MDVVSVVKEAVCSECLSQRCRKGGCDLELGGNLDPFLLIDMDHRKAPILCRMERKCDYIFVGGPGKSWAIPLEMKRGRPHADEMARQLQSGADLASSLIPEDLQVRFMAVGVYGGTLRRSESDRLRRKKVRFRRKEHGVTLVRCGKALSDVLSGSWKQQPDGPTKGP